jgi:hypothetical protein
MEQSSSWEANSHLVMKFRAFYGTRRFITVFTTARHWSLSWARCTQSTPSHPISLRSILILSSHLRPGLPCSSSLQVFQPKYFMHFSSLPCVLHLLDLTTLIRKKASRAWFCRCSSVVPFWVLLRCLPYESHVSLCQWIGVTCVRCGGVEYVSKINGLRIRLDLPPELHFQPVA